MDNPSPSSITGGSAAERGLTSPTFFTNAGFGLVVLCFFLSFFDFRCNGTTVASASGMDLALGNEPHTTVAAMPGGSTVESLAEIALRIDQQANEGKGAEEVRRFLDQQGMGDARAKDHVPDTDPVKPNPWAIAALGAAFAGLMAHLLMRRKGALVALVLAVTGATTLFMLHKDVLSFLGQQASMDLGLGVHSRVEAYFGIGYQGAWLGFLIALIASLVRMREPPVIAPTAAVPSR